MIICRTFNSIIKINKYNKNDNILKLKKILSKKINCYVNNLKLYINKDKETIILKNNDIIKNYNDFIINVIIIPITCYKNS